MPVIPPGFSYTALNSANVAERPVVALIWLYRGDDAVGPIGDRYRLRHEGNHLGTLIDEDADFLEGAFAFRSIRRPALLADEPCKFGLGQHVLAGKAGDARFPPRGDHPGISVGGPEEWTRLELARDEDLVDEYALVDDIEVAGDPRLRNVLLNYLGDTLDRLTSLHDHFESEAAGLPDQLACLFNVAGVCRRRAPVLEHGRRDTGGPPLVAESNRANLFAVD